MMYSAGWAGVFVDRLMDGLGRDGGWLLADGGFERAGGGWLLDNVGLRRAGGWLLDNVSYPVGLDN